jgi:hypothetical protein
LDLHDHDAKSLGNNLMAPDKVECLSGQTYADRPTAIIWEGRRIGIKSIEARWRTPGGRRFLIKTEDDKVYELNYQEAKDEWSIHPD